MATGLLPTMITPPGGLPPIGQMISDLERRVAELEARRSTIGDGTLTGTMVSTTPGSQIVAANIQAGTIDASLIQAGAITAGAISVSSLSAISANMGTLTSGSITATASIHGAAITAGTIAATSLNVSQLSAITANFGTMTAGNITAGAIIAGGALIDGSVGALKLSVVSLSAITANMGTLTAGTITGALFQSSASNPRVWIDATGLKMTNSSGTLTLFADGSSGKITALAGLGGFNELYNSRAENSTTDWVGSSSTIASSTTVGGHSGPKAFSVTSTVSSGSAWIYPGAPSGGPPPTQRNTRLAKPTEDWTASGWVRGAVARTCDVRLRYFDSSYTQLTELIGTQVTSSTTGWTRLTVTGTAPANTAYVQALYRFTPTTIGDIVYWTDLQLELGTLATAYGPRADEILPATISGGSAGAQSPIVPNTVLGSDLVTDTITTREMFVADLSALSADMGTITAGTITGGTIRTAASGARLELTTLKFAGIGSLPSPTQLAPAVYTAGVAGTGLAAATYYYKITASDAAGQTLPSAEFSAVVTANTQGVKVRWRPVPGAVSYAVYYGTVTNTQNKGFLGILPGSAVGPNFFLTSGGYFELWHDASVDPSFSANTPPVANTTLSEKFTLTNNADFSLLAGTITGATIRTASTDQMRVELDATGMYGINYLQITNLLAATVNTVGSGGLAAGTYIYRVSAYRAGTSDSQASLSSGSTGALPAGTRTVKVTWTPTPKAEGYAVYRSSNGGSTWVRWDVGVSVDPLNPAQMGWTNDATNDTTGVAATPPATNAGSEKKVITMTGEAGLTLAAGGYQFNKPSDASVSWTDGLGATVGQLYSDRNISPGSSRMIVAAEQKTSTLSAAAALLGRDTAGLTKALVMAEAYDSAVAKPVVSVFADNGSGGDLRKLLDGASASDYILAKGEHVRATANVSQTINAGVTTTVNWPTEDYDVTSDGANNQHDNTTNNTRLTCQRSGIYAIYAGVTTNGGGPCEVKIRRNGNDYLARNDNSANFFEGSTYAIAKLTAGDYVEVVYQNGSGANRVLGPTSATNSDHCFSMSRIGSIT